MTQIKKIHPVITTHVPKESFKGRIQFIMRGFPLASANRLKQMEPRTSDIYNIVIMPEYNIDELNHWGIVKVGRFNNKTDKKVSRKSRMSLYRRDIESGRNNDLDDLLNKCYHFLKTTTQSFAFVMNYEQTIPYEEGDKAEQDYMTGYWDEGHIMSSIPRVEAKLIQKPLEVSTPIFVQ